MLTASPNANYTANAYAYVSSGDHQTIYTKFLDQDFQELSENSTVVYQNGGFQSVSVSSTSPAGTKYMVIILYSAAAYTSDGCWDDVSFTEQPVGQAGPSTDVSRGIGLAVYPNPSNPSPVVQFQIHQAARAVVDVFDVLGRHVATLMNAQEQPGTYTVRMSNLNLPSGMYFCSIQGDSFVRMQKFVILK